MKIMTKKQATDILTNSLFIPINGKTLSITKFDNGKYVWHGSQQHYVGREVPDLRGIHAVYVERRKDKNGPYAQVMAISEG